MIPLRDRLTVLRAPDAEGAYGSADLDWSDPAATIYPALIQPLSSAESVVNEERTTTKWRAVLPAAADVRAVDRATWDGLPDATLEVDGEVERWPDIRGRPHHIELVLTRVSGG